MKSKNIMIITLVPLRADHLSCYGYHRDTTPNIDRIAVEGTIFERAYSTGAKTPPAHASLLTGLYPSCHGILGDTGLGDSVPTMGDLLGDAGYHTVGFVSAHDVGRFTGLDRGFQEFYLKGGYRRGGPIEKLRATRALIHHVVTLRALRKYIARRLGRVRKPERFAPQVKVHRHTGKSDYRSTKDNQLTTRRIVEWLDAHGRRKQPFFILLHYNKMHHPYAAPPPYTYRYVSRQAPGVDWRKIWWISANPHLYMYGDMQATPRDFEVLKALYDAEIHYVDNELGQVFSHMRRLGILDQTLLVILSPHGESFGEHGQCAHGGTLYETLVHVPLIVRCPGIAPAGLSVRSLVQLTDVLPTVLELVGRGADDLMLQGRSLLPIEPDRTYRQFVIAESQGPYVQKLKESEQRLERFERGHRMLRQGDYKYMYGAKPMYGADGSDDSDDGELLFDLASDPDELHNLVAEEPERAHAMAAQLDAWLGSFEHRTGEPEPEKIEEEILEDLRAGGYRI